MCSLLLCIWFLQKFIELLLISVANDKGNKNELTYGKEEVEIVDCLEINKSDPTFFKDYKRYNLSKLADSINFSILESSNLTNSHFI